MNALVGVIFHFIGGFASGSFYVPYMKFILSGITTISTDFEYMGRAAANLIKNKSKDHIELPFHVIIRDSI